MRYMPHDYPTNTMIRCVMVTGEGHGQNFLKSPADAHGFKFMKRAAFNPRVYSEAESRGLDMEIRTETVYYEPFMEFWSRDGFVRCFAPRGPYDATPTTSFLQVADALRIAGITEISS